MFAKWPLMGSNIGKAINQISDEKDFIYWLSSV